MNKKLIKKYKAEFDYWLDNREVLTFNNRKYNEWELVDHENYWLNPSDKPIFIINDEYVEFRKALAEGKTVQFFNTEERLYDSSKALNTWHNTDTIRTHGNPADYRIKPDEPEFRVGDWVLIYTRKGEDNESISNPVQVTNVYSHFIEVNNYRQYAPSYLELWQPQSGDWCVIPSTRGRKDYCASIVKYNNKNHSGFVNIEPFIGTLPTFIEETKWHK